MAPTIKETIQTRKRFATKFTKGLTDATTTDSRQQRDSWDDFIRKSRGLVGFKDSLVAQLQELPVADVLELNRRVLAAR